MQHIFVSMFTRYVHDHVQECAYFAAFLMKILLENCHIFRRFTLTSCQERNNLYFACYMLGYYMILQKSSRGDRKQQFERPSKFVQVFAGNTLPRVILLILRTILLLFCFTIFLRVFRDTILPFTIFYECSLCSKSYQILGGLRGISCQPKRLQVKPRACFLLSQWAFIYCQKILFFCLEILARFPHSIPTFSHPCPVFLLEI